MHCSSTQGTPDSQCDRDRVSDNLCLQHGLMITLTAPPLQSLGKEKAPVMNDQSLSSNRLPLEHSPQQEASL